MIELHYRLERLYQELSNPETCLNSLENSLKLLNLQNSYNIEIKIKNTQERFFPGTISPNT
jgi:hypothetical protein